MTLQLRYVTHSEIGLIRKNNQDSGYASPHLLVVADGMGGAAAGDLASAVAIDTIRKIEAPTTGQEMLEVLAGAIHLANDKIAELVESDLSLEGMGTTVTGAMFDGAQLGLAHIGDSRAYLSATVTWNGSRTITPGCNPSSTTGRSVKTKPRCTPPLAAAESTERAAHQRPRPRDGAGRGR